MGAIGYLGVLIAVLGFGSNFIPLKRVKIGDGVFFQFIMCCAIFMTSIPVVIVQKFPQMHGLALLGGFLWCTGNMLCPIAIRCIGMGLGLLVWGSVSMIMGWASGRFGLFGLTKQSVSDPTLNTIGVVVAIIGLLVFLQVQTNDTSVDSQQHQDEDELRSPLFHVEDGNTQVVLDNTLFVDASQDVKTVQGRPTSKVNSNTESTSLLESRKRIIGLSCAILAGVFFGCNFDPPQYVIDHHYDGDANPLDFVFSHFTGILLTSWVYTIIYCLYKSYHGEKPYINADIIIPGTISGILWAIAQTAWFFANGQLGFAVTFPIISCGPGFVGSLWGIFLFKEITGFRNLGLLAAAALITVPALIMIGLSK